MPNQQLLRYIKEQIKKGYTLQQITSVLAQAGHNKHEITETLKIASKPKKQNKSMLLIILFAVILLAISLVITLLLSNQEETNQLQGDASVSVEKQKSVESEQESSVKASNIENINETIKEVKPVQPMSTIKCHTPGEFMEYKCDNQVCRVLIITDSEVVEDIDLELKQYAQDIKKEYNFISTIKPFQITSDDKSTRESIHEYIKSQDDVVGVLLIGDIPPADFYDIATENTIFVAVGYPQSDLYYQDLNGNCKYLPDKNAYDINSEGCQNVKLSPPFWISRLTPPLQEKDNWANLLKDYFQRNHEYRNGLFRYDKKFLGYLPLPEGLTKDERKKYFERDSTLYGAYTKLKLLFNGNEDMESYLEEITSPYEFVYVNAHGTPKWHEHNVSAGKIPVSNPLIYYFVSCSVGRFTEQNNLVATYLFNGDTMFTSAPTTSIFGDSAFPGRYIHPLTYGIPIFEVEQLTGRNGISFNWLGDPTLRMRYDNNNNNNNIDNAAICLGSTEINFGNIEISNDELVKETIKIYNKGNTQLEFGAYILLSEGHQYSFAEDLEQPLMRINPGKFMELSIEISVLKMFDERTSSEYVSENGKKPGNFQGELVLISNDFNYNLVKVPFKGRVLKVNYIEDEKPLQTEILSCASNEDCIQKCRVKGFDSGLCIGDSDCICS